jgi:hypothetical protein
MLTVIRQQSSGLSGRVETEQDACDFQTPSHTLHPPGFLAPVKSYQNPAKWARSNCIRRISTRLRCEAIYACEAAGEPWERYVALARSVYRLNDSRTLLKPGINLLLGCDLLEEKAHAPCRSAHEP